MQAQKYSIKKWAKDDQPREKLLRKNPQVLSDSELLAILIQSGIPGKSAIELAREVLKLGKGDLNELGRITVHEMVRIRGIGPAKASIMVAALELARRRQAGPLPRKTIVRDSRDVAVYVQSLLRDLHYEVFAIIFLNRAGRVRHFEVISQGGITGTVADPRLILKRALEKDAVSIILCHNHPSGNLQPSKADEELTKKIKEAANYLDIKLLDHIIVSEEGHFSFADKGML
ncbi:MAG TPA: DNA repair protein RadC [Puia sp.]|nr:DNA repair protein RadC [Puia sp.]